MGPTSGRAYGALVIGLLLGHHSGLIEATDAQFYRRVQVSASKLTAANSSLSYPAMSNVHCGAISKQSDWAFLMCYKDGICSLNDVPVPKSQNDDSADSQFCYTKLDRECVHNDEIVQEGNTVVVNCVKKQCSDSVFFDVATPTGGNFQDYGGSIGCIFLHEVAMTWDLARADCHSYGTELFIPPNYADFQAFMDIHASTANWYWIGERGGIWLDDMPIAGDSDPMSSNSCGVVHKNHGSTLYSGNCGGINHFSICQFI